MESCGFQEHPCLRDHVKGQMAIPFVLCGIWQMMVAFQRHINSFDGALCPFFSHWMGFQQAANLSQRRVHT